MYSPKKFSIFVLFTTLLVTSISCQGILHGDVNAARPFIEGFKENYAQMKDMYHHMMGKIGDAIKSGTMEPSQLTSFTADAQISYNVSELCMNQTLQTINDLSGGQLYALTMFDAWAKLPSGILSMNLKWTGAYEQCLQVTSANKTSDDYGAKYCATAVFGVNLIPPSAATQGQEIPIKFYVCVPDSCSNDDVAGIMNSALSLIPKETPMYVGSVECSGEIRPYSAGDIVALVICAIFLFLNLLGTGFDYFDQWRQHRRSIYVNGDVATNVTDDVINDLGATSGPDVVSDGVKLVSYRENRDESTQCQSILQKLLLSFSLVKNGSKLFDISNTQKDIQVLHGIRAISMSWVILGHVHLFYVFNYDNIAYLFITVLPRWTFQAIGNATFSVDTFFFLSGMLVTYLTLKFMRSNEGRMRWAMFYVHRYLRLTPVYAFCLLFFTTLFYHLHHVPDTGFNFLGVNYQDNQCEKYWWSNLLYINNFVPLDNGKQCFGWAWYLANDMQFYVISPLILIPLYKKPKIGFAIIGVLILLCLGVTGFISAYFGQFGLVFGVTAPPMRNLYDVKGFDYIYGKPYTRIATYLVGMATGYVLYMTGCNKQAMRMKPAVVLIGWVLAISNALAVLYGFSNDIKQHYTLSYDVLAFYTSVSRFAWSLSLAWLTIACVHGYGGPITQILEWKFWIPMSRLTYCAYLVHPIVIMFHVGNMSTELHYDDMTMVYMYIADLVLSYAVAIIVTLFVEGPLLAVEKIFIGR